MSGKSRFKTFRRASVVMLAGMVPAELAQSAAAEPIADTYRFLTSERAQGGALYKATARDLKDQLLPLSFVDTVAYWGEHVCGNSAATCTVTDRYDPHQYSLRPDRSVAGDLQTERINTHNGANIYDAATWQIAVMLGHMRKGFVVPGGDAYKLISSQNRLLQLGYSGDGKPAVAHQYRAITAGNVFRYNDSVIVEPERAFVFRTIPRAWLAEDPLIHSKYSNWIKVANLPGTNDEYQRGKISWTDWKPIAGENAWAFLIGPLQAANLHYRIARKEAFVPFDDLAIVNALAVLPTFAAMQSPLGAVYYAPEGTIANQGDEPVSRYEVAVENNISIYSGLSILRKTLQTTLTQDDLSIEERTRIQSALKIIGAMIEGGVLPDGRSTAGLLDFFHRHAWRNGEFVQGGFANDPKIASQWLPRTEPRAVDVNTWGIAALGARQIDAWFGFGAAYQNWQRVKRWGGYGTGTELWGVGFSDRDGNGMTVQGNYRQGVLSTEWTAGAIVAVREMMNSYRKVPTQSTDHVLAQSFLKDLQRDERSMLRGIEKLRSENYSRAQFPGAPTDFDKLFFPLKRGAYLYASRRYLIPFGWYANPMPSTCSAAWMVMVEAGFDPLKYHDGKDGVLGSLRGRGLL